MSILVVDDSEDARTVLAGFLRDAGYEDVDTADCAEEAYGVLGLSPWGSELPLDPVDPEHLAASTVQVILMDIGMPTTDGLEACRRIKESARLRDVPVIIVTGQSDARSVRAAFSAGAASFLPKPVRRADLVACMSEVLGRARC